MQETAGQTFKAASLSVRCSTCDLRPKPRAMASVAFSPPAITLDTVFRASCASFAGKKVAPAHVLRSPPKHHVALKGLAVAFLLICNVNKMVPFVIMVKWRFL